MTDILNGQQRTHKCGQLSKCDIGKQVTIMGWVHRRRDLGALIFLQLRDISGICQVVFDDKCDKQLIDKAGTIKLEYVVAIEGTVRARVGDQINKAMATGEIEVVASQLKILSIAETTPFSVGDESTNELLRLKHRYLDLRRQSLQHNLLLRSKVAKIIRNYLDDLGFCEIETPVLGKSTPEGARDYLVPSRVHPGEFYALPQSPQLFKQLLMIGGMDRYYQIVKCFRDEDLRANRQPEFTQVDIEMSFVDNEDYIIDIMEEMIVKVFCDTIGVKLGKFNRMTYADAMEYYGVDKPDMRYEMKLQEVSVVVSNSGFVVFDSCIANGGVVKAIVAKGACDKLSRKDIDKLAEFVKTFRAKGLAWYGLGAEGVKSSFAKAITPQVADSIVQSLDLQQGDIAFFVADKYNIAVSALGELRCHLAKKLGLIDNSKYAVTWVVDFPLYEYSEEDQRYYAKHHPFTMPKAEDIELMKTDPSKVRACAYDLVINGDEMGGGSMRIYNADIQKTMFEILGFSDEEIAERFGFFVDAFKYGTPPHGGIAFGLDRLIMVLAGTDNIKDVIAFPKTQTASDMMTQAPSPVDASQLAELSLDIKEAE